MHLMIDGHITKHLDDRKTIDNQLRRDNAITDSEVNERQFKECGSSCNISLHSDGN